ncbi:ECF RNA polymerase sigma factor SigE [Aquisphaera giovannonii]|uniref:ECF RNA polymerase sigma factor SigE n=1 Tax=Aquisphaera giovannonii TaxID=406548 RepID=A0A5B9W6Q0_9BACT|nr:sigma-70 family RNA polymerase sigma factor [Aquisphaera giovannonii]QEH35904.1 ECF RNA polymerase sigma factor SigE [Aquisphaera giovannonii]
MSRASAAIDRDVQGLFEAGTFTGLGDGELVERFRGPADAGAEAAFEAIVRRHGPMVWRVCRNVLGAASDAEDAFQATFLVLASRRGSLRKRDSLASWLYGIASRVSARARVEAARRRRHEAAAIRIAPATVDASAGDELTLSTPIIQEEVSHLPEKYRSVVLLCYWEGLTHEQAAARLGCPVGTVRSRVARARDLLRTRLLRRGLAPTSVAVAALTGSTAAEALTITPLPAPPPDLVRSAVAAAMSIAAGLPVAGIVPAGAESLSRKVLRSLTMITLTKIATAITTAAALLATAHAWAQRPSPDKAESALNRTSHAATIDVVRRPSPGKKSLEDYVIEPPDLVLVEVLEALPGRPISGERLVRPDGKISLGWYGEVYVAGLTLAEAKAKIVLHLRQDLSDYHLGLGKESDELDDNQNIAKPVPQEQLARLARESKTVFVDVTGYNSKVYYVEGEVAHPDRFPVTGSESVLDAIHYAGGVLSWADRAGIKLVRSHPQGSAVQVLPIDYDQITMGADSSTNYQLMPGDRIVVPPNVKAQRPLPGSALDPTVRAAGTRGAASEPARPPAIYYDRSTGRNSREPLPDDDLKRRISEIERKLDAILMRLDKSNK